MIYSDINPAFDRLCGGRAEVSADEEVRLALSLRAQDPNLTYGQALKRAAVILAQKRN